MLAQLREPSVCPHTRRRAHAHHQATSLRSGRSRTSRREWSCELHPSRKTREDAGILLRVPRTSRHDDIFGSLYLCEGEGAQSSSRYLRRRSLRADGRRQCAPHSTAFQRLPVEIGYRRTTTTNGARQHAYCDTGRAAIQYSLHAASTLPV